MVTGLHPGKGSVQDEKPETTALVRDTNFNNKSEPNRHLSDSSPVVNVQFEGRASPEGASTSDNDDVLDREKRHTAKRSLSTADLSMSKSLPVFPTDFDDFQSLELLNQSIQSLEQQISAAGGSAEQTDDKDSYISIKGACLSSSNDDLSTSTYATANVFYAEQLDEVVGMEAAVSMEESSRCARFYNGDDTDLEGAIESEEVVWESGEVSAVIEEPVTSTSFSRDQLASAPGIDDVIKADARFVCIPLAQCRSASSEPTTQCHTTQVEADPERILVDSDHVIRGTPLVQSISESRYFKPVIRAEKLHQDIKLSAVGSRVERLEEECGIADPPETLDMPAISETDNMAADDSSMCYAECLELITKLVQAWALVSHRATKKYVSIVEKRQEPKDVKVRLKTVSETPLEVVDEVPLEQCERVSGQSWARSSVMERTIWRNCQSFQIDTFNCGELWKEGEILDDLVELYEAKTPQLYHRAIELPRHTRARYDHSQIVHIDIFQYGIMAESATEQNQTQPMKRIQYADIREAITTLPKGHVVKYHTVNIVKPQEISFTKVNGIRVYHKPVHNWVYKHQTKVFEAKDTVSRKSSDSSTRSDKKPKVEEKTPPVEIKPHKKLSRAAAIQEKVRAEVQSQYDSNERAGSNDSVEKHHIPQIPKHKLLKTLSAENKQSSYYKADVQPELSAEAQKEQKREQREEMKRAKLEALDQQLKEDSKKREHERQKAAMERKKAAEERERVQKEREAQRAVERAAAQAKLKEKFEQSLPTEQHKPAMNRKQQQKGEKTRNTENEKEVLPSKTLEVKESKPENLPSSGNSKVNDYLKTHQLQKAHRMAQSAPDLRLDLHLNAQRRESDSRAEARVIDSAHVEEDESGSDGDDSSLVDSQSAMSDSFYDSDSSASSLMRSSMYRLVSSYSNTCPIFQ